MSVREELEKLTRLQDLDLKIDRARKLVSSAPQAFSQLENEFQTESATLEQAKKAKDDFEKQKRQLETENMMDSDRIKNIEARLNSVTNNKEFHAASKEAEKAKKLISDRAKAVSELTDKILAQVTIVTEGQTKLDGLKAQMESKKSEVGSRIGEADKEIAAYAGDRASMASQINPPLMSKYNRIRTRYSDAIVAVTNGHCSSCNLALPPQMYIQVQKGLELISCPSCQRLLFHKIQ